MDANISYFTKNKYSKDVFEVASNFAWNSWQSSDCRNYYFTSLNLHPASWLGQQYIRLTPFKPYLNPQSQTLIFSKEQNREKKKLFLNNKQTLFPQSTEQIICQVQGRGDLFFLSSRHNFPDTEPRWPSSNKKDPSKKKTQLNFPLKIPFLIFLDFFSFFLGRVNCRDVSGVSLLSRVFFSSLLQQKKCSSFFTRRRLWMNEANLNNEMVVFFPSHIFFRTHFLARKLNLPRKKQHFSFFAPRIFSPPTGMN